MTTLSLQSVMPSATGCTTSVDAAQKAVTEATSTFNAAIEQLDVASYLDSLTELALQGGGNKESSDCTLATLAGRKFKAALDSAEEAHDRMLDAIAAYRRTGFQKRINPLTHTVRKIDCQRAYRASLNRDEAAMPALATELASTKVDAIAVRLADHHLPRRPLDCPGVTGTLTTIRNRIGMSTLPANDVLAHRTALTWLNAIGVSIGLYYVILHGCLPDLEVQPDEWLQR